MFQLDYGGFKAMLRRKSNPRKRWSIKESALARRYEATRMGCCANNYNERGIIWVVGVVEYGRASENY